MKTISLKGVKEFDKWVKTHKELFSDKKAGIPLPELFPDNFMKKYTDFANIERLLQVGGYEMGTQKTAKQLDTTKLDEVIRARTAFNNWNEMLVKAGRDYISRNP